MRILGAIVQAFVRTMLDAWDQFGFRGRVRAELVGDHDTRRDALAFQQLADQSKGGFPVAPALHKRIENIAFGVDGPPEPEFLSLDGDDHLVEMPFVGKAAFGSPPNVPGILAAEFSNPLRDCLKRNVDPALGKQVPYASEEGRLAEK